jgi:hypothetical protein
LKWAASRSTGARNDEIWELYSLSDMVSSPPFGFFFGVTTPAGEDLSDHLKYFTEHLPGHDPVD